MSARTPPALRAGVADREGVVRHRYRGRARNVQRRHARWQRELHHPLAQRALLAVSALSDSDHLVCVCVVCSFALLWVLSPPCGLVFPAAGVAVSAGVGALVRLRVAACVVRF
jgi:hypothetical protein